MIGLGNRRFPREGRPAVAHAEKLCERGSGRESVKMERVGEAVRLTVVPDEGAAETLCGLLRTEGIDCFYRDTDVSAAGVFGGSNFGGWREILVAKDDLERARELLPDQPLT